MFDIIINTVIIAPRYMNQHID